MIGQTIRAKVIKLNRRRGNVVLSRRAVLEEEREEKKKHTLEVLARGHGAHRHREEHHRLRRLHRPRRHRRAAARHRHVAGAASAIPRRSSRSAIRSRSSCCTSTGRPAACRSATSRSRPTPGSDVEQTLPGRHARRAGRVVSLTNYGAFVELEPGVEGLVHVSEMSWTRRVRHPSKLVNVGDEVDVIVLDVNRGDQADLARHEAGRARSVDHHRGALPAGHARAGQGAQPHRLRRLRRAGAGRGRPAAHLRHVVDAQRRASVGDAQEGPGRSRPRS